MKICSRKSMFNGEVAVVVSYGKGTWGKNFVHVRLLNGNKNITLASSSITPCRIVLNGGKYYGFTEDELKAANLLTPIREPKEIMK